MIQNDTETHSSSVIINSIIDQALQIRSLSERIEFISSSFLGAPYQVNPLVGSASTPERFTTSISAFDCVTFCETVLALTFSKNGADFNSILQQIRYKFAQISWLTRNHYMTLWIEENIKNNFIKLDRTFSNATISRLLSTLDGYPPQEATIYYRPIELFSSYEVIKDAAFLLFVSTHSNLDYFHLGIAGRKNDELYLRHAAKSIGSVNDELFSNFLARNSMLGITMLEVIEER